MGKIFLLETRIFYYFDENDGENVEDIYLVGYFSTQEKVAMAIEKCVNAGVKKEELVCTEIDFSMSKNQKYVYVLWYEYSIIDENGDYTDYYYKFPPLTNIKKCIRLKEKLLKENFYKPIKTKIFDDYTDRGFSINKEKIDEISLDELYLKK